MNIILKFSTYTSRLQIVLNVFNFQILFQTKGITCFGVFGTIKSHFTFIILFIGFDID